jgi:hypothetical protein
MPATQQDEQQSPSDGLAGDTGCTPRTHENVLGYFLEGNTMKFPRRRFLRLAAGAAAVPAISAIVRAQPAPTSVPSKQSSRPLAERLAGYADRLRYEDIDAATIERVKSHVIDAVGCGIAALDEPPVKICREVALVPSQYSRPCGRSIAPKISPPCSACCRTAEPRCDVSGMPVESHRPAVPPRSRALKGS